MRFGAIDIGSNAIRILFEEVYETPNGPKFQKLTLLRLPVRLGEDAFLTGGISSEKKAHLISMAHAFNHLCSIFEVEDYRATATSAMRDSKNGMDILQEIKAEIGVDVQILSGEEEVTVLYESIFNTGKISDDESYMFIDVGGGSTEINFFVNGERAAWRSFNIGTIRLKENLVKEEEWNAFHEWIKEIAKKCKPKYAVGTGGNINKIYKLCSRKNWELLRLKEIEAQIEFLKGFSHQELVNSFDIRKDRADVIVPGGSIYMDAMKDAGIKNMIVPKVGLADGLIRRMYLSSQE